MRSNAAFAVAFCVALSACATPAMITESARAWSGQQGGRVHAGTETITDEPGWLALWRRLDAPAPALDFDANVAIAVFAGERPTGGYRILFEEPRPDGNDVRVRWSVLPPGGIVSEAFTRPWSIRVYPRPRGRIIAEEVSP